MQMVNDAPSGTKRKPQYQQQQNSAPVTTGYYQPANMAPAGLKQAAIYQSPAANNYAQVLTGLREQAEKRNPPLGPGREKQITGTAPVTVTKISNSPYNRDLFRQISLAQDPKKALVDQYAAGEWDDNDAFLLADRMGVPRESLKRAPAQTSSWWGNLLSALMGR